MNTYLLEGLLLALLVCVTPVKSQTINDVKYLEQLLLSYIVFDGI
ncbi:hypothetical protein [Paraglaciecola sp.]